MASTVILLVDLKIADTTAFTTLLTLKKMGLPVKSVKRSMYYCFTLEGDAKSFADRITKADVLVNFNKHTATTFIGKMKLDKDASHVLVQNLSKPAGLMGTLQHRLGFGEIAAMEAGVVWHLVPEKGNAKSLAKAAAVGLLHNRHYQKYSLI